MNQKHFNERQAFRFKQFARKAYSAFNSMHKVVNIGVIVGCTLAVAQTSTVSAQTDSTGQQPLKTLERDLDEVMVTASRVEMPIAQTAKLVTVITKEQIAQAPVYSIQDLLAYSANIDVIQRGGHGVQADISIRGGSFDQTAILLNGVNLSNSQTGHYSFDIPINLSDIERIEVLHGPSALIYGSSAFSGGINIITKKKVDAKGYARVESGMHDLRGLEVRGASQIGNTVNSLSVGYNSSDGYMQNTDYDLYNLLWQTRLNLENESKIDLQLGYNDKKYGANSFYTAKYPNQYEQTSTYMGTLKGEFGSDFKIIPILYWNRHHDEFQLIRNTNYPPNYHRNDTYGANLIFMYRSKLGNTSLGSELRREDIMSTVLGDYMAKPHRKYTKYGDRTNVSVALEHTMNIERISLSAGVLMNHNTIENGKYKFFPSVSMSYRPADKINIYTSWSNSTRMPTFTDLGYTTETHEGNDGLKPEKSQAVDLGVKYNNTYLSVYATGFLMWGRNIIDWVKVTIDGKPKSASWNHTKLNTQGVEMGVKLKLTEFLPMLGENAYLALDYARMHQDVNTGNYTSEFALQYLRDKFTTQFNHQIYEGLSASWYLRFQKRMGTYTKFENAKEVGKREYPAFSTLDLKLNYKYNDVLFNLSLNNLYDTYYFDRGNIPMSGFWLTGGISYTFR